MITSECKAAFRRDILDAFDLESHSKVLDCSLGEFDAKGALVEVFIEFVLMDELLYPVYQDRLLDEEHLRQDLQEAGSRQGRGHPHGTVKVLVPKDNNFLTKSINFVFRTNTPQDEYTSKD